MEKKKIKLSVILLIVLVLTLGVASYAGLTTVCHHNYTRTTTHYESVKSHSGSIYTEKNGIENWWPVIYYDDYIVVQYSCAECGKRIPELDVKRFAGTHWEFAY